MKYYIHPTRAVFGKNAIYYNAGMPYPLEDDEPPMRGSIECTREGVPFGEQPPPPPAEAKPAPPLPPDPEPMATDAAPDKKKK